MKKLIIVLAACTILWVASGQCACAEEEGAWPGVDATVVGKYAEEHGRPASEPLINLEGDALLFAFLIGGVVGGFAMGYYYREFTASGREGDGVRIKKDRKAYEG